MAAGMPRRGVVDRSARESAVGAWAPATAAAKPTAAPTSSARAVADPHTRSKRPRRAFWIAPRPADSGDKAAIAL